MAAFLITNSLADLSRLLRSLGISAEDIQLWVAILAVAVVLIRLFLHRLPWQSYWLARYETLVRRAGSVIFLALAVLAAFNYFYHSRSTGSWLHRWDIFHSAMNSRYFEELGYFKLYECTVVLGSQTIEPLAEVHRMRNLETLAYIDTEGLFRTSDCAERFADDQRASFARDLQFWNELMPARWDDLLLDKGYNGTPFYTLIYQGLIGDGSLRVPSLTVLARIDLLLLAVAFLVVFRTYGADVALFSFLFFTVNFPNRFVHMGGAILRFDYIALLILGICALKSKRFEIAGSLVAIAAAIRIFPLLFAAGLGVKMISDWFQSGKLSFQYVRFFMGLGITLVTAFLLSLMVGGVEAWLQFFENSLRHNENTAGFRIGLRHLFMLEGNLFGSEGFVSFVEKTEILRSHSLSFFLTIALFVVPLIVMAYRINHLNFAIIFGCLTFFLLFASTRYYYSVLVLLFLLIPSEKAWAIRYNQSNWLLLFMVSVATYLVWQNNDFAPFIYNTLLSTLLAAFFVWLGGALYVAHGEPDSSQA